MSPKRTPQPKTKPVGRAGSAYALARNVMMLAVLGVLVAFGVQPVERPTLPVRSGPAIADARSWGYQLQNVKLVSIPQGTDVLVVDYSRDGSEARSLKPAEIDRLRTRDDGSKRIVLAYMSIGEAENYRFYWKRTWTTGKPSWLGAENPEWKGNFQVRYWEPGWREVIVRPKVSLFGRLAEMMQPAARPYLDRIIDAGFDGVYLDRVDAFEHWAKSNQQAQLQMIEFVASLSAYAKMRRPGFLVVPQNGEPLLRNPQYRQAIDAVAKEDLVYGASAEEKLNSQAELRRGIRELNLAKSEGRPVFVVEYVTDPAKRADVAKQLEGQGYIIHFARRDLRNAPE